MFPNYNGRVYCIVAGNDRLALLRDIDCGEYVLARGLNWEDGCWSCGAYFDADEFEMVSRIFVKRCKDEE